MLTSLQAGESALTKARQGFTTNLVRPDKSGEPPDLPPSGTLLLTSYQGPLGSMAAYVSPSPKDGKKHPAIIWITGGFSNSIGAISWTPGPKSNDQSASGFRDAGIITMYPSLRGGNQSPGYIETFYGEVDDIIAAAKYLSQLDYVDPQRIYLGGHSTGGTLVLLVAESTDVFRAIFSLGPVGNVLGYGQDVLPFDMANPKEGQLRAPLLWLNSISRRTFVFEGEKAPSNIGELRKLVASNSNILVSFHPISSGSHFSIINPLIAQISQQILKDQEKNVSMDFSTVSEPTLPSPHP